MSKEDKTVTNQYAFIWNYNAHVDHQHNYMGGKPEREKAETLGIKIYDSREEIVKVFPFL